MSHPPIGIVANPRSGRDVRRIVAAASSSTLEDKISIIRRVVIGARSTGATRFLYHHDPHRLVVRATETMTGIEVEPVDMAYEYAEADSEHAAAAMAAAGCGLVVVLGGDGTNRAVARGWPDVPVVPLSTGTNNAFPSFVEPTVAGAACGLLVTGTVPLAEHSQPAKIVRIEVDGDHDDVALVDAVVVDDPYVGSLELFDPATLRMVILSRADPAAIGFSAVGGLVESVSPDDDHGLLLRLDDASPWRVRAPTAPGHFADIGIVSCERLGTADRVTVSGPTLFAFDGERKRRLHAGQEATARVSRDGPRVIDVVSVMGEAMSRQLFVSGDPATPTVG